MPDAVGTGQRVYQSVSGTEDRSRVISVDPDVVGPDHLGPAADAVLDQLAKGLRPSPLGLEALFDEMSTRCGSER